MNKAEVILAALFSIVLLTNSGFCIFHPAVSGIIKDALKK